jgi:hypothetical protein
MRNPWKAAALGVLALAAIVGTSTLTTAYLLRPPLSQPETTPAPAATEVPAPRAAVVRVTPPSTSTSPARVAAITPVPASAGSTAVDPDCDTGGDRAARIAKPGALGALLGASLGAAGGAIANGGKAAGQGALIGGLAGAAVGAGYGAYKTKTECGTVFGSSAAR